MINAPTPLHCTSVRPAGITEAAARIWNRESTRRVGGRGRDVSASEMDARDSSQSQVKSSQSQSDAESESRVNEFVTVIAPDTDFGCECECERRSIRSAAAEAEAIAAAIAPGALCLLCSALPCHPTRQLRLAPGRWEVRSRRRLQDSCRAAVVRRAETQHTYTHSTVMFEQQIAIGKRNPREYRKRESLFAIPIVLVRVRNRIGQGELRIGIDGPSEGYYTLRWFIVYAY